MNGKFEMTEEVFKELSLDSQLVALYRQSNRNYEILNQIKTVCECRVEECAGLYVKKDELEEMKKVLEDKISTKSVLSRAITGAIATVSGAVSGFLGGKI